MALAPGQDRTWKKVNFTEKLVSEGQLPRRRRPRKRSREPQHAWCRDKPNVLWLMADQLRADCFGFMGHPLIRTPNLDRLAAQGAYCTRSYCSSPVCMPARATLLSGHYTFRHGVVNNGYQMRREEDVFPPRVGTAGYRTGDIGKNHHGHRDGTGIWEYHQSVEDLFGATKPSRVPFDPDNYPGVKFIADIVCDNSDRVLYGTYPGPVATTKSHIMATEAMKWLYWHQDPRPFFFRVSFDDPHPPVVPPEPFASMYDPADVPPDLLAGFRESMAEKPRVVQEFWRCTDKDRISEDDHRMHAAKYFGLVSHLDAQMGRIIDYLEELGIADNTIVIVNSDHGHMIGEHGLTHKHVNMYEGVSRVPTIVRWPGKIAPGTRVEGLIEGVDFLPTVLDMLGISPPADLDGTSFLPLLTGKKGAIRDHAFVQWDEYGFCIVGERWKLGWWDPWQEGELYDLVADPLEKVNLFDDPRVRTVRDGLLKRLREWRSVHADPHNHPLPEITGGEDT